MAAQSRSPAGQSSPSSQVVLQRATSPSSMHTALSQLASPSSPHGSPAPRSPRAPGMQHATGSSSVPTLAQRRSAGQSAFPKHAPAAISAQSSTGSTGTSGSNGAASGGLTPSSGSGECAPTSGASTPSSRSERGGPPSSGPNARASGPGALPSRPPPDASSDPPPPPPPGGTQAHIATTAEAVQHFLRIPRIDSPSRRGVAHGPTERLGVRGPGPEARCVLRRRPICSERRLGPAGGGRCVLAVRPRRVRGPPPCCGCRSDRSRGAGTKSCAASAVDSCAAVVYGAHGTLCSAPVQPIWQSTTPLNSDVNGAPLKVTVAWLVS